MDGFVAQMRTPAGAEWPQRTSVATVTLLGIAPRVQPHLYRDRALAPKRWMHAPTVHLKTHVHLRPFVPSHQRRWIHHDYTLRERRRLPLVISIQKLPHLFEAPTTPQTLSIPPTPHP